MDPGDDEEITFKQSLQSTHQFHLSNKKKNTRRKHRNSHLGCGTCKKRRIKCDENLPSCLNCLKGKLHCAYLNLDSNARNALRMAQYNQNLRNDKFGEDLQSDASLIGGSMSLQAMLMQSSRSLSSSQGPSQIIPPSRADPRASPDTAKDLATSVSASASLTGQMVNMSNVNIGPGVVGNVTNPSPNPLMQSAYGPLVQVQSYPIYHNGVPMVSPMVQVPLPLLQSLQNQQVQNGVIMLQVPFQTMGQSTVVMQGVSPSVQLNAHSQTPLSQSASTPTLHSSQGQQKQQGSMLMPLSQNYGMPGNTSPSVHSHSSKDSSSSSTGDTPKVPAFSTLQSQPITDPGPAYNEASTSYVGNKEKDSIHEESVNIKKGLVESESLSHTNITKNIKFNSESPEIKLPPIKVDEDKIPTISNLLS